ncbi:eCIS core domain-containing protein [Chryseobacterium tongliaoense]|uniref:eCIS core domain-containing protein n=1 Tax=Chryseobacterium tongliaoense TaxID=3240933 RepID=UPI00351206C1
MLHQHQYKNGSFENNNNTTFFKPVVQKKLNIGSSNDSYEAEADRVADQVMSKPGSSAQVAQKGTSLQKCAACEQEEKLRMKPLAESITPMIQRSATETAGESHAPDHVESRINSSKGNGNTMDHSTKSFMENRFGADFSNVKIHTGSEAVQMNRDLNAQAFAVGNDIYFNEGKYSPNSDKGKHLLAHELTHTIQQGGNISKKIQKLSAASCSADCSAKDGTQSKIDKNKLVINVDKEADFLTIPLKKEKDGSKSWPVGHSWITLIKANGDYWTYGFWPETGFNSSEPFKSVNGCVHHPDTAHTASSTQEFTLTDTEFDTAKNAAINFCNTKPDYNLYDNQCTSFTNHILKSVKKNPIGGYGLIWDSPNSLSGWMNGSRKTFGIGYDFNSNSFQNQSSGISLQGSYVHQFYSILGNKIRFQSLNQASIGFSSKAPSYLSSSLQIEFKPQKIVYLPDFYIYGGGAAGLLSPNSGTNVFDGNRWGAGVQAGAGLNYNIQNSLMIGFEYGLIKNLVKNDPILQSLSLKIGFVFQ